MKLGLFIGYAGASVPDHTALVKEAERLGYDSVWAAEAYGNDAVTVLSWMAARTEHIKVASGILQMPARTPAMTAMTAITLSELSGGRFVLGLGVSGPQVVEGWHGVPYGKPLQRTREFVSIVRAIAAREAPLQHDGSEYQIPYEGPRATGLGKPLKSIVHPTHDIPIYLASIGPKNVALTAEIADGWLPTFFSPFRAGDVWGPSLRAGFEASGEVGKADRFEIAVNVPVILTSDKEQARWAVKPALALYIGGMGAKGRNFYYDLAERYGHDKAAEEIQQAYLSGDKTAAVAAVPDALVDEISLIGSQEEIADRLDVWREAGVTSLLAQTTDVETLRTLAEVAL